MNHAFPYLLLPVLLGAKNRARRREKGDLLRGLLFAGVGLSVAATLLSVFFWLTWRVSDYEELGEYLVRLGLSWLFLTFLSFLAFSAVVTSLSTFFLSEDLRLLMAAPVSRTRFFYSRFAKTAGQASWMVVVFVAPVLLGVGLARCAPLSYYLTIVLTTLPFVVIPVAFGSVVTLLLVNVFPARRARDILMLIGLLFGITPLFPSFWAGESLFSALSGGRDWLHLGSLWTTALASMVLARAAYERAYFSGWSKAQEARKTRFTQLLWLERLIGWTPLRGPARSLLIKDVKVFLRDTTQWSQLLLLLALAAIYVYNFRVLDLERIPYMSRVVKNAYAFVNLAMASFVLSAVAVRFVFPAVSAEGAAFWLVRVAPVGMRAFLWSKFWTGLLPILLLAELLTIVSNEFLGTHAFLKLMAATAVFCMSFALVGLAAGMGARYPRFKAENVTQVAGSYGGVAYMILAVLFIVVEIALLSWPSSVFLWSLYASAPISGARAALMGVSFALALALCVVTFLLPMRQGVRALEALEG
jgi:ABC-2 type transport system permease protein